MKKTSADRPNPLNSDGFVKGIQVIKKMTSDVESTVRTLAWLVRKHYVSETSEMRKTLRCKKCYWTIYLDRIIGQNHITVGHRRRGVTVTYLSTAIAGCDKILPKDVGRYSQSLPALKEKMVSLFPKIKDDVSLITKLGEEVA